MPTPREDSVFPGVLNPSPHYLYEQWGGRTPKAGGRMLDGRTWDELPAQSNHQEQMLALW